MKEMIRVYTLGQLRLERNNGTEWLTVTDAEWQQQRVRILLRCLVSLPTRSVSRTLLLNEMWPEREDENANGRLDRAVHNLRHVFEPDRARPASSPLLLTARGMIVLADQQHIWVDADAFEQTLAQAHANEDLIEKERLLEEAVNLYHGDFLPEAHSQVILQRRDALWRTLVGLLFDLADMRLRREALIQAAEPLQQLLSIDPTHEAAAQRLMRVLVQLGRRSEALRAYKRLSSTMQQELHIVPSVETHALYETIRAGTIAHSEAPLISSSQERAAPLPLRLGHAQQPCEQTYQDYEFIDVMRGSGSQDIYMTLFDDHSIRFFLLAVIQDTLHFPIGSTFRFQVFHPDAPSANPLLPEAPVGTASFLKQEYSIEIVTTTGILTELLVTKFGFTNSSEAPAIWKLTEIDVYSEERRNKECTKSTSTMMYDM